MWKSKLPQKLKVFAWQLFQDRLQTGENLKKRNWKGNERCCLCRTLESNDHIFFKCHLAKSVWTCFKEALGWDRVPNSLTEVLENWIPLGAHDYHVKLFMLVITLWGIWTVRNKMAIEKSFPRESRDVFIKIFKFMQKWRILLKDRDARFVDEKMEVMKQWLADFWNRANNLDVEGVL